MIEWKDPPRPPRNKHDWATIAAELRQHPGQWGLVGHDETLSVASLITTGKYKHFPRGQFEATCRNSGKGSRRGDLYVRYIGDGT